MSKQFTRAFRVRWSETNANGQVEISGYLRYLMETAWDWGATSGLGITDNDALGLTWLIRETEINFYRPLYPNDVFDFEIWLVKWRRVRGTRCFELRLKDGRDLIANGVQQVVTLDSKTTHPAPPPENIIEKFRLDNPRVLPQTRFPKYCKQLQSAFSQQRDVEWRDLDSFEHVNNAAYATFAVNAAAQALAGAGWPPPRFKNQGLTVINRRFHIRYLMPALWGDRLNVAAHLMEVNPKGGSWYIEIERKADGQPIMQCVIEWALENRISGEEQMLPADLSRALEKMIP